MKAKTKILIGIGILCIVFLILIIEKPEETNPIDETTNIPNETSIIENTTIDTIDYIATDIENYTYDINITEDVTENVSNITSLPIINKTNISETRQINKTIIKNINAKDAYKLIKENLDNENFVIIDLRTPWEFKAGHIKNAVNIDYYASNFVEQLKKLNKSRAYLIYCKSGGRSKLSLEIFQELNFEQIYHLVDGIESWKYEGFPVEILE